MLALSRSDLRNLVSMPQCIELVKQAFVELSENRAVVPLRLGVDVNPGTDVTLVMPAFLPNLDALGFKVVSVFQGNPQKGVPATNAMVCMIDQETGIPTAILNGAYLTQLRTGAVSGAAAEYMARKESKNLVVIGGGAQGVTQAVAICAVRPIEQITVVDPFPASFDRYRAAIEQDWPDLAPMLRFTDSAEEPVRQADIICLATTSKKPVFQANWVKPGTHVSGVGSFTPEMQEAPSEFVANARVVVDMAEHALEEAGDLIVPMREGMISGDHIVGELGEMVQGNIQGRTSDDECTFFKSVGNAVQDITVGNYAVVKAREQGIGQEIDLG